MSNSFFIEGMRQAGFTDLEIWDLIKLVLA